MMNLNAILIYFVFLYNILLTSTVNSCTTPNGSKGNCIVLSECEVIYNVVKQPESVLLTRNQIIDVVRQLNCGYQGKYPMICCPYQNGEQSKKTNNQNELSAVKSNQLTIPMKNTTQSESDKQNLKVKINSTGLKSTLLDGENKKIVTQSIMEIIRKFVFTNQTTKDLTSDDTIKSQSTSDFLTTRVPKMTPSLKSIIDEQLKTLSQKLKLLPEICGRSLEFKYFVGNNTELDDFPWLAILEYETPIGKRKGCGGVLISERYILTAAHCVTGLKSQWRLVGAHLGNYNLEFNYDCPLDDNGPFDVVCAVPYQVAFEEHIVHPEYTVSKDGNRLNDIALLRLAVPAPSVKYISSICLPFKPPIRQLYLAAGWGKTLYNNGYNQKRMTRMTLQEPRTCSDKGIVLSKEQFCAISRSLENSCVPDEGGPLMGIEEKNDRFKRTTVFGILSYIRSTSTVHCSANNWPAVYTNVQDYMPWILDSIKK